MLGKLLKYELKATSRTFLPIYGALILVALVNRLFRMGNIDLGFGLTTLILVGLFVALGVLTLIVTIQRFNRNLLGDEGYLMFTLPVEPSQLILSKSITTVIWGILSGIVGVMTFVILLGDYQIFKEFIDAWPQFWNELMRGIEEEFNGQVVLVLFSILVIGILSYVEGILMIYLALATGQLPIFAKHRGIISFVAFFVLNIALELIMELIGSIIPFSTMTGTTTLIVTMCGIIILDIVLFMGINYIVSKHLNLE